ncbi:MAG: S8 family peptidase [Thermoleophilia bacterium]|jgi:subtilisin family serine protease
MPANLSISGAKLWVLGVAAAGAVALGGGSMTAAGAVTPELEARLAATPAGAELNVIALMEEQVDGDRFDDRPAALLRALRATAARTQDDVAGEVSGDVRSFWLVNAIAFSGTPAEVREVAAHPSVADVDLDPVVRVTDDAVTTATPFATAPEGNWGLAAISTQTAWRQFGLRGEGVRVGSIDTGIAPGHADLAGKVVAWRDFVNGAPNPYDDNGHGTHTAGTIAGGSAGGGPIGVAPGARLVVAKAMGANGAGPGSALLAAAEWMTDPDGNPGTADHPSVVNNSWSSSSANDTWFRPMVRRWRDLGIVPVFSAGNTGPGAQTIGSPAGYPEVVAVGAIDRANATASFSSRGPVVWQNLDGQGPAAGTTITKPDVAAPGINIVSSVGNGYLSYSGTSMASPHVAGLVALLRQANPGLSPDQIADILRGTAADLGAAGPDFQTGAGRVDANRAVAAALGAAPAPTPPGSSAPGDSGAAPGTTGVTFAQTPGDLTSARVLRYRVRFTGGAELVRTRVDGGPWSAAGHDDEITLRLPQGRHVVEAQGLDFEGNSGTAPARHVVTVDHTPPWLRVTWRRTGRALVFTARTTDANGVRPGSVRWHFGFGDVATGARVTRRFADDARRRIVVTASDAAGNTRRARAAVRPRPASAPVSGMKVRSAVRHGRGRIVVSGLSRRASRMSVRLRTTRVLRQAERASGAAPGAGGLVTGPTVARASAARSRGPFAVGVPVRRLRPGTYRVELAVGATRSIRTIRIR